MLTDLLLLLILILLNGVFAMSEIAIVSSKRARLTQLAGDGNVGARHALTLASEPTRFLSSVQVGITSIGILNGAIGEAAVASRLRVSFQQIPVLAPYADGLALGIMVVLLTYVSLILGELVPKRLALTQPERIASIIARPMEVLATIARPLIFLLSTSTDSTLRLVGVRQVKQPGVTVDEIRVMLEQGAEEGVFEPTEHELVTNVLNLDERRVGTVLTPRSDIVSLDVRDPIESTHRKLSQGSHTVLPLCDGGLDKVLGFVRATKVLEQLLEKRDIDLATLAEASLFVPEAMSVMKLLEQFKRSHLPMALVVDEFGSVAGLVSLTDVISSIVGDLLLTLARSQRSSSATTGAGCSTARWTWIRCSMSSTRNRCSTTKIGGTITPSAVWRCSRSGACHGLAMCSSEVSTDSKWSIWMATESIVCWQLACNLEPRELAHTGPRRDRPRRASAECPYSVEINGLISR